MVLVRSDWKRLLVAVRHTIDTILSMDTHTWCGLDGNAPVAGTELPANPPVKKENITGKLSARSSV